MKSEWKMMKASEFIDFNPKISLKKGTVAKKIAMDKLMPFTKKVSDYEIASYSGGAKFCNGDTIMARITPCLENGKTAYIDFLEDDEIAFGSTEFIVMRAKEGISDSQFIYYLSISPYFREIAIKSMVGSSGRQRVQQSVLEELELLVPPLEEQEKIGQFLKNIDDKIALNQQINNNLEQQAQAIFKSWFVDFEPFNDEDFIDSELGKIPNGWEISNLTDIAEYLNGLAMQKFRPFEGEIGIPVMKIKELRQGGCDNNSELCSPNIKNEYIIQDGDVIFSWSGSLLVDIWCGGICGLNQHLFKVSSNKYDKWFYYMWTKYHLNRFIAIAADKATTMGHIKREELDKAKVLIPSKDDYSKINSILNPIFEMIILNRIENKRIIMIRDILIPKLMTGKIHIPLEV